MIHLAPPRHCAGAEMMLMAMLEALVERGHRVDVLLSRPTADPGPYDWHGITVHPHRDKADPFAFLPDADVVVTHLENTPRASILALRAGKPIVQVIHNTHEHTRMLLRGHTDLVVYNSQWMAEKMEPTGHRHIIVRPPVVAERYRTTPGDRVTLVNCNADKGGLLFARLAERMPDVEFLAVLGAYGEQHVPYLPNVAVSAHVPGDQMRDVYGRTRVLLVPSAYESWGRVGVEAMCSGIPVIAHPTPGLRESLGDAGTFADRDDPDAWEAAIRGLLDGRRWKAASRKALARAAELDPTDDLARWVDAMEHLATRRRAA